MSEAKRFKSCAQEEVIMQELPESLINQVASFADLYTAVRMTLVCRKWLRIRVPWTKFTRAITDASVAAFVRLCAPRSLREITCCQVTDAGIPHLRHLHELESVRLTTSKITDAGVPHLANLTFGPNVTDLSLNYMTGVTDVGAAHLARLVNLKALSLDGCCSVADLEFLGPLVNLTSLNLAHMRFSDAKQLHHIPIGKLQNLCLEGDFWRVAGSPFDHLANSSLKTLDLTGCNQLTGADMKLIAACKTLEELNMWSCSHLPDSVLQDVATLVNLNHLNIGEWEYLPDAALAHLVPLQSLRFLNLSGCSRITDAGIAHVAALANLQKLVLTGLIRVTGAALLSLAHSGLQELRMWRCSFSKATVRQLHATRMKVDL